MEKENFDPKDFASFEELPKEKKPEFKPVEGGFVGKDAIKNDEKAEIMAHAENSIRLKMDEVVKAEISRAKESLIKEADSVGESAGNEYDKEQRWQALEKLGEDEDVLDAVQRLKASFEEQGLEYGDKVEVCLKDGSCKQGYHDDGGRGAESWARNKKDRLASNIKDSPSYGLGTSVNQGQISFAIRGHIDFPVQAIERVVLVSKRHSSQIAK